MTIEEIRSEAVRLHAESGTSQPFSRETWWPAAIAKLSAEENELATDRIVRELSECTDAICNCIRQN
jgi:hypothetical protein